MAIKFLINKFKNFFILVIISCSNFSDIDLDDYKKGIHYYKLQNYDSSVYYLKNFLRKVPRYKKIADTIINAHILLAKSLENKEEYDLAILVYNDLIKYLQKTKKNDPRLEFIRLEISKIYEKKGVKK
ncbi:MAG: hypothetical protein ABIL37_00905 [candidate division WOR-3 bacterium]